jgi:hypothetical protein
MSSNELGDLTRVQIAAGKGRKTSIVGAGESMKALREAQDLAAAVSSIRLVPLYSLIFCYTAGHGWR